jgi:hypothetical protein
MSGPLRDARTFKCGWLTIPLALLVAGKTGTLLAQVAPSVRIPVSATLVLTSDLCTAKSKKGSGFIHDTYPVGKCACDELEPALRPAFSSLTRTDDLLLSPQTDLVLLPRLLDFEIGQRQTRFTKPETRLQIEWTLKNNAGTTIWLETILGSAKGKLNSKKDLEQLLKDTVDSNVVKLLDEISNLPEVHKTVGTSDATSRP